MTAILTREEISVLIRRLPPSRQPAALQAALKLYGPARTDSDQSLSTAARRQLAFFGRNRAFQQSIAPQAILSGPADTGKTITILYLLDQYAWQYAGAQLAIIRKTRSSMTGSVLQSFEQKILPKDTPVRTRGGSHVDWYDYPNGSRIWIGGMDKPEKVLSSERDVIYVNQVEELTLNDWEFLLTRANGRAGNMPFARVIADCNPGGRSHWILGRRDAGILEFHESRHEDNPTIYDQATGELTNSGRNRLAALDNLTGVRYERLRKGRWVSSEGIVFETYDPAIHHELNEPLSPIRWYFASVDWGFTHPGVCLIWGVDGDGRMYLVRQYYLTRRTFNGYWLPLFLELQQEFSLTAFVCDPSEPNYLQEMTDVGLEAVKANNAIRPGIDATQERLRAQADGRARLYLLTDNLTERDEELAKRYAPACLEDELEVYIWKDGKEKPVDKDNHGCDAMRYAVMYANEQDGGGVEIFNLTGANQWGDY
jgi:phage terminase large subunit